MKRLVRRKEEEWLELIKRKFPRQGAFVGIGDDSAVIDPEKRTCVTTDLLVESVDFEKEWAPPEAVGWKALAVNLSDLAAMGAVPRWFLLSLGIPGGCGDEWVERMLDGVRALAKREGISLIGGDLSGSPDKLVISVTALGVPEGKPIMRGTASPGDGIYVTAPLGGPASALGLFRSGSKLNEFPLSGRVRAANRLMDRFYRPPSQARAARLLCRSGVATSAIDISDGLLLDLSRLLAKKGQGAVLGIRDLPRFASPGGGPAGDREVLSGGEEQTLLFTARPEKEGSLKRSGLKFFRIGEVTGSKGIWLESPEGKRRKAEIGGFEHFS